MEEREKLEAGAEALPTAKKKKIPWGMLYIAATIVAVVLFGVINNQFRNVFRTMSNLTPGCLTLAILVTLVYFLWEGGIIKLLMKSQNIPLSMGSGVKIGLIGIYYSYITPSSTGGQPMQAAYLRRDKIPVGVSTAVLIMKFFCFQCAFFLISLISFLCMYGKLAAENPGIIPFIVLGLVVNGGSIIFFPCLFIKRVMAAICRFAKWLVRKLSFLRKKQDSLFASIERVQEDFGSYTDDFKEKKKSVLWGILLSVPQFILQMSVIYFVFRSFGYREISYWEVLAVQSLLQVSVSFMPMPGASGAQEIGFSAFFQNYFHADDLYTAIMVWRFFTYYLVVIAGALVVVVDQFLYNRRRKAAGETGEGVLEQEREHEA